jgi:2-phosphoglycerate kinase
MEYCSAVKKKEIMLFAEKWIELEMIMLSEINQDQQGKYCMWNQDLKKKDMNVKGGLIGGETGVGG